jgi:hypothetical protein
MMGGWKKLHNEKLGNLIIINLIIKPMKMTLAGHVARMGKKTFAYSLLVR